MLHLIKAGINDDNLTIALEPEAASMYCKKVPLEKLSGPESEFQIFSPGNQYLILDAGGMYFRKNNTDVNFLFNIMRRWVLSRRP